MQTHERIHLKEITSRSNPLWRDWMHQRSVAGRPGHLIWLDGQHLCQAWLTKRGQPLWAIFDQAKINLPDLSSIYIKIDSAHLIVMSSELFAQLSTVKAAQGVLFLVEHLATASSSVKHLKPQVSDQSGVHTDSQSVTQEKIEGYSTEPGLFEFDRAVLLDSIQDPGNVGTILRLSAALGVSHVILGPGCAAVWSPKVLRSAQGAHFALTLVEVEDLVEWLNAYRQNVSDPASVLATAVVHAHALSTIMLPKRSIWLFGHEGQGISPPLLDLADIKVKIEHDQTVVDSLNVASAAAICLFEQSRQHSLQTIIKAL
jgi:TrmH family RNA methyltransferase